MTQLQPTLLATREVTAACCQVLLPHIQRLINAAQGGTSSSVRKRLQSGSVVQTRHHGNHAAAAVREAESKAPSKLKQHLKEFAKLPWEVNMGPEQAAKVLGSFLGVPHLPPATVLNLTTDQTHAILQATTEKGDKQLEKALHAYADGVTNKYFGEQVFYRGIVEFSNVCQNDCGYCGIRKHQPNVKRYTVPVEEVVEVGRWAFRNGMGTLMLQAGELDTPKRLEYVKELVRGVRQATIELDRQQRAESNPQEAAALEDSKLGLCVALSVGELDRDTYQQLFDAGARRYLLRIESSNPDLYALLHPASQRWERRVECLNTLKDIGFQVGTGVMVGLPGQNLRDLAGDISFFKTVGADMIGMGPYITESNTPVAAMWEKLYGHVDKKAHMKSMFELTTRMNALARITLGNVNIAATTALQAIDPMGREIALRRGSNILMPILTPTKYREHYQLYEGKPCITDTADECRNCLSARISMIGKKLREGAWADPPHFLNPIPGLAIPPATAHTYHTSSNDTLSTSSLSRPLLSRPTLLCSPRSTLPCSPVQHTRTLTGCSRSCSATAQNSSTSNTAARPPGPAAGSDVPRINIGVFGVMNAGKSTLMNAITRQETSIVDSTPGTTADVKVSLMELHDIGPAKLFDTAGIDETGELGAKKRHKTLSTLKECDVAVIVVDVARLSQSSDPAAALNWERQVMETAKEYGVEPLVLYNTKGVASATAERVLKVAKAALDPNQLAHSLEMDLHSTATDVPTAVSGFLQDGVARTKKRTQVKSLPEWALGPNARIFLNIPMDAETPTMRLLRPQALVQEEAIRYWSTTTAYRMDLAAARGSDPALKEAERKRFMRALQPFIEHDGPKLMITDSQAVDIVHPWTLDPVTQQPLIPFSTFSICMIHRQSGGKLPLFIKGLEAVDKLGKNDKVLIAEACNHNRITVTCNDIGMVQIPQGLEAKVGKGVQIEHAFGREYPEVEGGTLGNFKLAIHCGGCMIDAQKMRARILDMEKAGVPVTNYGLLMSYLHSPKALTRALEPWSL